MRTLATILVVLALGTVVAVAGASAMGSPPSSHAAQTHKAKGKHHGRHGQRTNPNRPAGQANPQRGNDDNDQAEPAENEQAEPAEPAENEQVEEQNEEQNEQAEQQNEQEQQQAAEDDHRDGDDQSGGDDHSGHGG